MFFRSGNGNEDNSRLVSETNKVAELDSTSNCEGCDPMRSRVPVAPLGRDGGQGYYPEHGTAALVGDIGIVDRILSSPRWPVSVETRAACINWLASVIATSGDERAKSRAAASLIAADKLNIDLARLAILEEQIRAKRPVANNQGGGGITIILEGNQETENPRIEQSSREHDRYET